MQSLPTEAKPLEACSQCGSALPTPSGSATFVYGVGPVGYQSCDTCGAKWRYLWKDPPGADGGLNRLPFLLVGVAIVVLLGFGALALLRSPTTYKPTSAAAATTTPTTQHSTTSSPVTVSTSSGTQLVKILTPMDDARTPFVQYLQTTALTSQQYDVNQRVSAFVSATQPGINALKAARWPASAASDVDKLVQANQQFVADVELVQYGLLYSSSFTEKLTTDVQGIQKYQGLVRRDLGLPTP